MINQVLRYDHLLILIGRQEEEKFALFLETEKLKEEIEKLKDELEKWQTGQIQFSQAST